MTPVIAAAGAVLLVQLIALLIYLVKVHTKLETVVVEIADIKNNHLKHLQEQIDKLWDFLHERKK